MQRPLKRRLLVIGPMPPPYAGPEIGTQALLNSEILNTHFQVWHTNTTARKSNTDKGRVDFQAVRSFATYSIRLVWRLVTFRPHIVLYTPTSATRVGWVRDAFTILMSRLLLRRIFIQFRGGHFDHFLKNTDRITRGLVTFCLRRCRGVTVQAEILRRQFEPFVDRERIHVLYNFVPQAFLEDLGRPEDKSHDETPTVLFVGHLTYAKGYCDLLACVPQLYSRYQARFLVLGSPTAERNVFYNQHTGARLTPEDPQETYRQHIVANGAEDAVEFLGSNVHGPAKVALFRRADIFVLPSYSEGFSMAVLEAMAAGLPVVTTRVGAQPEVIEDGRTGYLIVPGDRAALLEKLDALMASAELREKTGGAAREACESRFAEDVVLKGLVRILAT